jgi:hypothetical protein
MVASLSQAIVGRRFLKFAPLIARATWQTTPFSADGNGRFVQMPVFVRHGAPSPPGAGNEGGSLGVVVRPNLWMNGKVQVPPGDATKDRDFHFPGQSARQRPWDEKMAHQRGSEPPETTSQSAHFAVGIISLSFQTK